VGQDEQYEAASAQYGEALKRLAQAYEADANKRLDLLQEIHIALWRSFAKFQERCSLRTWVYRVAHNAAASHVLRQLMVLYLEGMDAASMADITGISPAHVRVQIHRIKNILSERFHEAIDHES
jgi:RNA polymerase sigma-70 factor, ECF subfamily